ncbi:hypothetical protein BXY64_1441 [Marinifilum flexuosum]|uniref:Uncharacterized protein n=1 Tax=Marinifilum flexuosum TaxID=1117708 RepID=A0A419X9K7_9BACT|nr:hypothetical protein BXY64_1441 [Marinifilum flexuosum]
MHKSEHLNERSLSIINSRSSQTNRFNNEIGNKAFTPWASAKITPGLSSEFSGLLVPLELKN